MSNLSTLRQIVERLTAVASSLGEKTRSATDLVLLQKYLYSSRRPWQLGYGQYKTRYIAEALSNAETISAFRERRSLPPNYGYRLDARVVEIPWALSTLSDARIQTILDAGSSLNWSWAVEAPQLNHKKLIVLTLAPEKRCFWKRGISYLYGDIRDMPLKDNSQDAVVCISTIEHVGMDNERYGDKLDVMNMQTNRDLSIALAELKRVLKPGGSLLISFPFGQYENHGWFQQFDARLTDELIVAFAPASNSETIYCYHADGWALCNRDGAASSTFFDVTKSKYFDSTSTIDFPPHFPAGEGAVMCLELIKGR